METKNAKTLNETLRTWMVLCDDVVRYTKYGSQIEQLAKHKQDFKRINFDQLYANFVVELKENIREYRNIDYIDKYMEGCLTIVDDDDEYEKFDEDIPGEIIKNGYETKFFLEVANVVLKYRTLLQNLYYTEDYKSNYSEQLISIFNEVMRETDPDYDVNNDLEEDDSSLFDEVKAMFSFENLKTELQALKTKDKIALVKNRMIDIEQWYIKNGSDAGKYNFHAGKYMDTEFYKMCDSELKRIRLLSEVDEPRPQGTTISDILHPYEWQGTDTEFLELFTALYHSGKLQKANGTDTTRKEFLEYLQKLFGLAIKDAEGKLNKATNRKMNMTPFLDSLKIAFENYVEEKDEKQRKRK